MGRGKYSSSKIQVISLNFTLTLWLEVRVLSQL